MTLAHRRLGDRLLRVKFAPLNKGACRAEENARMKRIKDFVKQSIEKPFHLAGRRYVQCVTSDRARDLCIWRRY